MDREQVKEILKIVVDFYGKRVIGDDQVTWVNNWFTILEDENFDEINANLVKHIKNSEYPPKPNNIISVKEERISVPGVEETEAYIKSLKENKSDINEERINEHLENIRRILYKQED